MVILSFYQADIISINSTIKKIKSKYKNSMAIYKCDFSKKKSVINSKKKINKKL